MNLEIIQIMRLMIIIINDEKYVRTDSNPKHAFAFKSDSVSESIQVKVLSIEWKLSKDGNNKPTIIYDKTRVLIILKEQLVIMLNLL